MEGLAGYGGSSSEEEEGAIQQWGGPRPAVNLAPQVDVTAETEFRAYVDPSAKTVATNPTFEALSQPVQGPKHPFNRSGSLSKAQMNLANGNLEVAGISAYSFDEQLHTFGARPHTHTSALRAALVGPPPPPPPPPPLLSARALGVADSCGYASNPSALADASTKTVGDLSAAASRNGSTVWGGKDKNKGAKKRKVGDGDWLDPSKSVMEELTEEQKAWVAEQEAKRAEEKEEEAKKKDEGEQVHQTKTIFHGTELFDYQGRSFVDAPNELSTVPPDKSYLPKKCVHTWSGHTKGVTAIQFFPKTAHLLLSASQDNKVKIWNVNGDRKCMRTYIGHTKAVRDICFTNDGRRFVSAGFGARERSRGTFSPRKRPNPCACMRCRPLL